MCILNKVKKDSFLKWSFKKNYMVRHTAAKTLLTVLRMFLFQEKGIALLSFLILSVVFLWPITCDYYLKWEAGPMTHTGLLKLTWTSIQIEIVSLLFPLILVVGYKISILTILWCNHPINFFSILLNDL